MSEEWAQRQRDTNKLARLLAEYIFRNKRDISPRKLYGLSKLSWITNSFEGENPKYIISTKIPALSDIMDEDYSKYSLEEVAKDIAGKIKRKGAIKIINKPTGFTNIYGAYRNSVLIWLETNFSPVLSIFEAALHIRNSADRVDIIKKISKMPMIGKPIASTNYMKPEFFLTPALFTLDPEIKIPIINGNTGVSRLLNKLNVQGGSLIEQYMALISLYGQGGIQDAADLDQIGYDLPDFVAPNKNKVKKSLLKGKKEDGRDLPLKDEGDIKSLRSAATVKHRRIHNMLTNKLRKKLSKFTLLEGQNPTFLFDVMVKDYDGKDNDLVVEVKSCSEPAHVRMAIGQLYDYWYKLNGDAEPHLAILLPERPNEDIMDLLKWMEIGVMWFDGNIVNTEGEYLRYLVDMQK